MIGIKGRAEVRHVFRWDLDKTYLRTEFDTIRDLVKSAFERAIDKHAVPGAPALMKALRRAGGKAHRICIVSGSPAQMRKVLETKLTLDGVEWDEFVLKPNLQNLLKGRFRALRQQVPYKLSVLLESRLRLGGQAPETLFGDDAEADALTYSLYADLLAGRVGRGELERVLDVVEAYDDQRDRIRELVELLPQRDVVRRILIHLDRRSPTGRFARFGSRLCPIYNYFQGALILYADGVLDADGVVGVAQEMLASDEYELDMLANSLQDLLWRGWMPLETATRLALESQRATEARRREIPNLPPTDQIAWAFATRVEALGKDGIPPRPPVPEEERIDYVALTLEEETRRKRGRREGRKRDPR